MFKIDPIAKDYREAGALCSAVNLFGFVDDQAFLTKSGDVGLVLAIEGVDYECLDGATIDNLTQRLTAALRVFDEKCRVYQYLFKRNQAHIPHNNYANAVVNAAIQNRIEYLEDKASSLYDLQICYVVLFEGFRYKASLVKSLAKLVSRPAEAARELRSLLSSPKQTAVLGSELERSLSALYAKVRSFVGQVGDFVAVRTQPKDEAFRVLKQVLNFSPLKLENARLRHDTFLDYYLAESHLECHSGFLRVDDYYVKVLTLKEPSAQTFPLIFKRLLEVEASYFLCSEWQKQDPAKSRALIHSRRRHFHNTKRSLASYASSSDVPERADEVLIDESKEAQVRDLGQALTELEIKGNYFGWYSLTVVIYDRDLAKVETACADFYKIFSMHDAQLYEEK